MPFSRFRTRKFNNKKTVVDGIRFDSKLEAERYGVLKLQQASGQISDLKCHPPYTLQESFRDKGGKHHRAITYQADFEYRVGITTVIEDCKGFLTEVYKIKKKLLLKQLLPHQTFLEYKRS